MKEQEITIEEVPFSWDDNFSELALTKLKMIENGELDINQ